MRRCASNKTRFVVFDPSLSRLTIHGLFFNQIEDVPGEEKRDRTIKRETESLIMAVQEQIIRTNAINAIKAKIDKTQDESNCRL